MSAIVLGRCADPLPMAAARRVQGARHGGSKLKAEQVRWLRKVHVLRHPQFSASALARKLGVSRRLIDLILRRELWKHLQ